MTTVFKPRVTVAAIATDGDRYLMVEETIRGRLWLNQPAGHLESGEDLLSACRREVLEESGWTCRPRSLIGVWQWRADNGRQFMRFTFDVDLEGHDPEATLDAGILRTRWMSRTEIEADRKRLRSPIILSSLDRHAAGHRWPLDILESML